MKLVINRQVWLRGEGSEKSYLRRNADGKQCCVGIYCSALGIPEDQLTAQTDATRVREKYRLPGWLFQEPNRMFSSKDANEAYQLNDAVIQVVNHLEDAFLVSSESERERLLTEIFHRNGVEVEFVG